MGAAGAHSQLTFLSPEHSRSDVQDCQTRAPAKERQDTTRHQRASLPVSVTFPAGKQIRATHSSYVLKKH